MGAHARRIHSISARRSAKSGYRKEAETLVLGLHFLSQAGPPSVEQGIYLVVHGRPVLAVQASGVLR